MLNYFRFIVNDTRFHWVHTYTVHCVCSALVWWWLFYSRNK